MENGNGLTILAVDDQPDMLDFLSILLRRQGYQVQIAGTGSEGIAKAQDPAVDLVLLDVMLPDIDGYEVCLKIKEKRPLLPVIHLTVRDQPIDMITGLDSGADDYITKPFSNPVLLARVRAALRPGQKGNGTAGSQVNGRNGTHITDTLRAFMEPLGCLLQPEAIADIVVQQAGLVLDVEHRAVCIWRQASEEVIREHLSVSDSEIESVLQGLDREWEQTLYAELRTRKQPIFTGGSHPMHPALAPLHNQLGCSTTLVAPLLGQDNLHGALILFRNSQSIFSSAELDIVAAITCQVGYALDRAQLLPRIEQLPHMDSQQLRQTSEILSIMSHELRSPVAAIKGFITTLLSNHRYWDENECEAFLENVNESVDQLSRLVENVLEMGQLDKGLVLHRRSTRLTSLVQRVLHDLSFQSSRCELVNEVPAHLPMIPVDPLRIERVLRNLVENAVKFSPQGGRIRVFARLTEKEIEVGVQDQGIGIAPEHLPRIFERFYQVDRKEIPKEGVGLGLSIARELVHAHGGRVWAESTLGSGTTIRFTLPLNGSAPVPEQASTTGGRTARGLGDRPSWRYLTNGQPMILIVDDDQQMRKDLHATLENEGFEILSTSFGNEAIDLIQLEKPDLVLLDLVLPDVDGLAICEQVRRFSNVPIIIITGRTAEHPKVRGLALGADDYMVKPFSDKELLARIRALLRRARVTESVEPGTRLRFNGLEIDSASYEVRTPQGMVKLTPTEHKLLYYLASNAGRILTHQQILTRVWGYECDGQNEYLWVNISRLRKKIEPDPDEPRYIVTEPGLGYSFRDPNGSP